VGGEEALDLADEFVRLEPGGVRAIGFVEAFDVELGGVEELGLTAEDGGEPWGRVHKRTVRAVRRGVAGCRPALTGYPAVP
jgi:hypothetical protein